MNVENHPLRRVVVQGVIGGVLGGVLFALVEVATSIATGVSPAAPFRVIGSILLGPGALSAASPWDSVASTGIVLHFLLSVVYGIVLVGVVAAARAPRVPGPMFLIVGIAYSIVLWIVNFVVVAPNVFPQVGAQSVFQLGFALAHPAYGLGLGWYLGLVRGERETDTLAGRS